MTEYKECKHGRHLGAYCEECAELGVKHVDSIQYVDDVIGSTPYVDGNPIPKCEGTRYVVWPYEWKRVPTEPKFDHEDAGGSSEYYDLPPGFTYKGKPARLQDVIVACEMGWNQANIFKATYRWKKKPNLSYNLRKILWFTKEEKDNLE